jgi:hypothetical protein
MKTQVIAISDLVEELKNLKEEFSASLRNETLPPDEIKRRSMEMIAGSKAEAPNAMLGIMNNYRKQSYLQGQIDLLTSMIEAFDAEFPEGE